jgi:hypothetical protein
MDMNELKGMIRECIHETLAERAALKEALKGPGYMIKAWSAPSQKSGTPAFDSEKTGKLYADWDAVLKALEASDLSELGAYEITWIPSHEESEAEEA